MNIDFQRRVDRLVGVPLCALLSLLPRARDRAAGAPGPRKILIILLSEMGSLVLAQPMLSRLKRNHPEASLYALVFRQNREVLELLEAVPRENIFTLRNDSFAGLLKDALASVRTLRRLGIDTVIDGELFSRVSAILSFLTGASRRVGFHAHTQEGLYRGSFINRPVLYNPYQHIAQQFLTLAEAVEAAGKPLVKRALEGEDLSLRALRLEDGELDAMRTRLESDFPATRNARLVLIYPGGGLLPIRAWPRDSFAALVSGLTEEGFVVGLVGLASDRDLARSIRETSVSPQKTIDLTGYTRTVRELLVLFHLAELLVSNDGGPGHFAGLTPMRSIVLFGPETPALYGGLGPKSIPVFLNLSCSPCLSAYNHRSSPCDGDNQCLKRIAPDDVLALALRLLGEKGGTSSLLPEPGRV
jgi:ADP-heptose:LPS heptosyltransferase